MIDLHIHVLPGLDDGPGDISESVGICRAAWEDGAVTLVATPHMLDGLYNVEREAVLEGVDLLRRRLAEEGLPLEILPGADVRVDPNLPDLLRAGRLLTLGDRPLNPRGPLAYLLLELPAAVVPQGFPDFLFEVQMAGAVPVISHPERNIEVQTHPEVVGRWVEAGAVVQVTAGSILGRFGRRARRCVEHLLRGRLAHVVASDAHGLFTRPPGLTRARAEVARLLSPEEAEAMFFTRPAAILAGEPLELPEPILSGIGRRRRFFPW